jgi:hypothetical protein
MRVRRLELFHARVTAFATGSQSLEWGTFLLVLPTFTLTSVLSRQGRGVLTSSGFFLPVSCLTLEAGPAAPEKEILNPEREIPNDFKTPNTNTDTKNA